MTLLEATTTLIDAVKTWAPEEDRKIAQAVKRMEKRLFVLQVRAAWARKRNRRKAFYDAMGEFGGGVVDNGPAGGIKYAVIPCKACRFFVTFGDFCKGAEFTGHGRIIILVCPKCGCQMERSKPAIASPATGDGSAALSRT